MEGPPVAGTPEQLLLLTLARKLDDMDERIGARIDALAARIPPEQVNPPDLAEVLPPGPETAEEEGARIARALRNLRPWAPDEPLYLVGNSRFLRVGSLRHQENVDKLRKNGFLIVDGYEGPGSCGNALIRWESK